MLAMKLIGQIRACPQHREESAIFGTFFMALEVISESERLWPRSQEGGDGRTAHNNDCNEVNEMVSNTIKPCV